MSRIYLSPPDVSEVERALLLDAFDSNWIAPLGPHVDAFEKEFAAAVGVPYAVALSSGTAALHLALQVLGVRAGDDVIMPTLTFAATANAAVYVGARPVFLDVSRDTWTMDPDLLDEELTDRSNNGRQAAAVLSVDLYGQCADYARIEAVCQRHGVPLIEDAAEALGASIGTRQAGSWGRCGAFSFNGNKIITTSGGGMLVSHELGLIERARYLATQARDTAPHYEHSAVGYNYRLSNLLAAIGRGQLRGLQSKVQRRHQIRAEYQAAFAATAGVTLNPEAQYGHSNAWLTCVLIDPRLFGASREDVRLQLEANDIESRPVWKPMHLQPAFRECPTRGGEIAAALFDTGLCLPSGSNLSNASQRHVIDAFLESPRQADRVT